MSGIQNLTGVPWHVECFERKDGDERRHRSRCRFFQGKPYNLCLCNFVRCHGSAHCENYIEKYFKENEKSHKMQLKFGYKDEGIKRQKFVSRGSGKIEDEYITGLLKEEWIKQ